MQTVIIGIKTSVLYGFYSLKRNFELHHLTRRDTSYRRFGYNTLQIAYKMQFIFYEVFEIGFAEKIFHHVQAFVDRLYIFKRKYHPTLKQSCPHRTNGMVDNIEQAGSSIVHTAQQFQATNSKLIKTYISVGFYTGQRSDMTYLIMLSHIKILKYSARSDYSVLEMLYTKAFKVFSLKMFQQTLAGRHFGKDPVVQLERTELISEIAFKHRLLSTLEQHFFRREIIKQLIYVICLTFGCKKLTGRNIEKSYTTSVFSEMNCGKKVIFLIRKYIVVYSHTGGNQLGNTSLNQFLGSFRIFQLVANSNSPSGANQFRQISVERMVRKSSHLHRFTLSVSPFSKCDTQYFRSCYGIFRICFIKVSTPKQHYSIRVFRLQFKILFHHWGKYHLIIFSHGLVLSFLFCL